jgi:NADP-dependent 3-hydroxy acid dehydrogenase YdfG
VNVDGTMLCCRAAIPPMRRQSHGTIVNIGSISGVSPYETALPMQLRKRQWPC